MQQGLGRIKNYTQAANFDPVQPDSTYANAKAVKQISQWCRNKFGGDADLERWLDFMQDCFYTFDDWKHERPRSDFYPEDYFTGMLTFDMVLEEAQRRFRESKDCSWLDALCDYRNERFIRRLVAWLNKRAKTNPHKCYIVDCR